VLVATLGGCRGETSRETPIFDIRNMYDQPRYDVQEESAFFPDHRTMSVGIRSAQGSVAGGRGLEWAPKGGNLAAFPRTCRAKGARGPRLAVGHANAGSYASVESSDGGARAVVGMALRIFRAMSWSVTTALTSSLPPQQRLQIKTAPPRASPQEFGRSLDAAAASRGRCATTQAPREMPHGSQTFGRCKNCLVS
jgi:hypothetical protein